jgi:hypothetical protein
LLDIPSDIPYFLTFPVFWSHNDPRATRIHYHPELQWLEVPSAMLGELAKDEVLAH